MKIAIAGYGTEGRVSYDYWSALGNEVVIVDERDIDTDQLPVDASIITGSDAFSRLNGFDLVVRTAGLAPHKIQTDGKIWSATNEFFVKCQAPIIGVTGTKGKGTTCSLVTSILQAAGKTVHLVGNIGIPALEVLPHIKPDDIVVFELSSFQLWDIERSPHIAVVLLVEPEHLDVHRDYEDYVTAKANIARYQQPDDIIVFNNENKESVRISDISKAETRIPYPFPITDVIDSLRLVGQHNVENASAAIAAVREYVTDKELIRQGLAACNGLPHRLEYVRDFEGVAYYNDSFSSAPSATVAAIRSFNQPEILIIGGVDRGADFSHLLRTIAERDNIKTVLLIGEIRNKLAQGLSDLGVTSLVVVNEGAMASIVRRAHEFAHPGDVVILSPGCASFDMFKNFNDRGDQFKQEVNSL